MRVDGIGFYGCLFPQEYNEQTKIEAKQRAGTAEIRSFHTFHT